MTCVHPVEPSRNSSPDVVLFDFDGVIVRGDAFAHFVVHRYCRSAWRIVIALVALPVWLVAAIPRGGRDRLVRFAVALALFGVRPDAYRAMVLTFARTFAREPRNIRAEACEALARHRSAGDRVVVVTGCEESLARAILDELDFADVELVASSLGRARFGLRLALRNVRTEKPRQLALAGLHPPWAMVYTDSASDLPMLEGARFATLVQPSRTTRSRICQALGDRVRVADWD